MACWHLSGYDGSNGNKSVISRRHQYVVVLNNSENVASLLFTEESQSGMLMPL